MTWETNLIMRQSSGAHYSVTKGSNSLCHHGIPGQERGVRRFQDKNGNLTLAGRLRYLKNANKQRRASSDYGDRPIDWKRAGRRLGFKLSGGEQALRKQREEAARERKQAEKANKPDLIDRGISKVADQYGLGDYAPTISTMAKNAAKNAAVNAMSDPESRGKLNKAARTVEGILAKPAGKMADAVVPSLRGTTAVLDAYDPVKDIKNAVKAAGRIMMKSAKKKINDLKIEDAKVNLNNAVNELALHEKIKNISGSWKVKG